MHVPVEPFPAVLQMLFDVAPPEPEHVQPELTVPACAVSEVAASVACVWLYVPSAVQS